VKRAIQPDGLARPAAPYSPVVESGDLVFTAGQVAHDRDGNLVEGGIEVQTRQAIENLRTCLAAAGCGLEHVLKVSAFLADLDDFAGFNAVYREHFPEPYPVRTTVGADLPGGILVELDAVARRS
jgi:2-iminobutanoate/2-iminopropanoate deaminase